MRNPHGQQRHAAIILVAATLLALAGRAAADDADDDARPLFAAMEPGALAVSRRARLLAAFPQCWNVMPRILS